MSQLRIFIATQTTQQPFCFIDEEIEARGAGHIAIATGLVVGVCFVLLFRYLSGYLAWDVFLCRQYPRRPEKGIRSPELELHSVVSHSMCAGNQTSGREASVLSH